MFESSWPKAYTFSTCVVVYGEDSARITEEK